MGIFDSIGDLLGGAAKVAAPVLGASNPWLGAGIGLLGGALSGNKSGSTDPAAIAAGIPTMTPEQQELMKFANPYLKGWMTNPFKVTSDPAKMTNVTVGGSNLSYTPGSTSVRTPQVPTPVPQVGPVATQPQSATVTDTGNYGAFNGLANKGQELVSPGFIISPQGAQIPTAGAGPYVMVPMGNNSEFNTQQYVSQHPGSFSPSSGIVAVPNPDYQPSAAGSSASSASGEDGSAEPGLTPPGGALGPYFESTPGSVNIPGVPQSEPTFGTLGEFDPNDPYRGLTRSTAIDQLFSQLPEGYSIDYLNDLAEGQLSPLREAFQDTLAASSADYNRRGMSGATFAPREAFGDQPSSISRNFMREAGNIERDVNLRGLEAAREDRFRNAAREQQALDELNRILQTDEANKQWWSGFGQGQKEFDAGQGMREWQANANLGQWLTGREDTNLDTNRALDLSLQGQNIGYQQDALNNILSFIYGLNPQASRAQQNYMTGINQANQNRQTNATNEADAINWLTDIFTKQDPVSPGGWDEYIPSWLQPGSWMNSFVTGG